MKQTITTGQYSRDASHSYRLVHSLLEPENVNEITNSPFLFRRLQQTPLERVLTGQERFCMKYQGQYCERCKVECGGRT